MRTIGALPIGLTDITWMKFTLFNFASALTWTTILVGGGYLFGSAFERLGIESLTNLSLFLMVVFLITLYKATSSFIKHST
jgi:membrane protein DedA with SNARE-associated domain